LVKRGASIGSGAVLLCGITIGENAMIGAGSVVTKDVPPNMVVAGNPAKVIKSLVPQL
jgi:acetyltransferase-like isoleucine patch superfamily enzyme